MLLSTADAFPLALRSLIPIAAAERYGPLRSVWIARKPPGFAFIEYEDTRDAEDAVRKMDGAWQPGHGHDCHQTVQTHREPSSTGRRAVQATMAGGWSSRALGRGARGDRPAAATAADTEARPWAMAVDTAARRRLTTACAARRATSCALFSLLFDILYSH